MNREELLQTLTSKKLITEFSNLPICFNRVQQEEEEEERVGNSLVFEWKTSGNGGKCGLNEKQRFFLLFHERLYAIYAMYVSTRVEDHTEPMP